MRGLLLLVALTVAGYAWARVALVRSAEAERERARIGYRRLIAQDPGHIGAHEALGDSLRAAGRLTEARDAYVRALEACGRNVPEEPIRYKIRQVDLSLEERAGKRFDPNLELILCPGCGAANAPQRRTCEICNAPLPYLTFREAVRDKEVRRAALESVACALVLAVVLLVFDSMPLDIKGCLVMATVIVMGWRFLQAIGSKKF